MITPGVPIDATGVSISDDGGRQLHNCWLTGSSAVLPLLHRPIAPEQQEHCQGDDHGLGCQFLE
jgi:hypothetical protein